MRTSVTTHELLEIVAAHFDTLKSPQAQLDMNYSFTTHNEDSGPPYDLRAWAIKLIPEWAFEVGKRVGQGYSWGMASLMFIDQDTTFHWLNEEGSSILFDDVDEAPWNTFLYLIYNTDEPVLIDYLKQRCWLNSVENRQLWPIVDTG